MKKKFTYGTIMRWNNTIAKWRRTEDIHFALHATELRILEKKIAPAMRTIIVTSNEMTKKFFELDEKNQVKYTGEGKEEKPVMRPFMTLEMYEAEKQKLFATEVEVLL